MTQYEIETDDAVYEVEANSDEEAYAKVRAHLAGSSASKPAPSQPAQFLQGAQSNPLTAGAAYALGHPGEVGGMLAGAAGRVGEVAKGALDLLGAPARPLMETLGKGIAAYVDDNPQARAEVERPSFASTPLGRLGQVETGIAQHSLQQGSKYGQRAIEAAKEGDWLGAGAEAIRTPFAAFPLTSGSIESGERFVQTGDPRALGELGADTALALAPELAPSGQGARLGESLREGAHARYVEALAPRAANETLARAVAQQAIREGLWGRVSNTAGLGKYAKTERALQGRALQEAIAAAPEGTMVSLGPAQAELEALARRAQFGETVTRPDLASAVEAQRGMLGEIAPEGSLPLRSAAGDVWNPAKQSPGLVQQLEAVVPPKAYQAGLDPMLTARAETSRAAAEGLRTAIGEAVPKFKEIAPKYSFAKNLQKLVAQSKKTGGAGRLLKEGNVLGMAVGVKRALVNSPAFKTLSAVVQDRVGQLIDAGNVGEAGQLLVQSGFPAQALPPEMDEGASQEPLSKEQLAAQRVLQAFQEANFQPEELGPDQEAAFTEADQRAFQDALRTVQNPTYQALPVEGPGKTRAKVLQEIFRRHRGGV